MRGIVAAGHPLTAGAGADVLRAGGNAVDAALAAMLHVVRDRAAADGPRRRRLHAGGRAGAGRHPARLLRGGAERGRARAARAGRRLVRRRRAGVQHRRVLVRDLRDAGRDLGGGRALRQHPARRPGRAGRRARARRASTSTPSRRTCSTSSRRSRCTRRESRALYLPSGRPQREGERYALPELADALERLASDGPAPFYTGDVARAVVEWVGERGGTLTLDDLAAYAAVPREPVRVAYRGREVLDQPAAQRGRDAARATRSRCSTARRARRAASAGRRRDGARAGGAHAGVPGGTRRAGRSWSAFMAPASGRRRTSR